MELDKAIAIVSDNQFKCVNEWRQFIVLLEDTLISALIAQWQTAGTPPTQQEADLIEQVKQIRRASN